MTLAPVWSSRFKRDIRKAEKRGKDMRKLKTVLSLLLEQTPLPVSYKDHPLKGDWKGWRDLHIEPDWLLLYRIDGDELQLARTGTHSDLFDE
ncbi:MAG: type II toxin-antitoxin system YafQ family toxin [Rhizomicrobium sp.]